MTDSERAEYRAFLDLIGLHLDESRIFYAQLRDFLEEIRTYLQEVEPRRRRRVFR
ncbi:MAG: hypothetical protein M3134_00605 [Actinomycetota bacterium]|nr:hypothetical protein [Actinomycetota bacterium]